MLAIPVLVVVCLVSDLKQRVDALARPLIDSGTVTGFSLAVLHGDEEIVAGYGRAFDDRDDAPDGDTLFEIGSISKVFTSLLIAEAAQRGELQLEDAVNQHLPESVRIDDIDPDDPIRLFHLASHVSGLPRMPNNFAPADPTNPYVDYSEARLFDFLAGVTPRDTPGQKYEYSNLAAGLLGVIATQAAGADDYESLLLARICAPLGLADTSLGVAAEHAERFADPHDADGRSEHRWEFGALAGAGGIRSSANDMLRFARAQLDPSTTPLAAAIPATHTLRHPFKDGGGVALGWHVSPIGVLWHNGQTGGYHGFLACDVEQHNAVVILANGGGAIDALGDRLVVLLRGGDPDPVHVRASIPLAGAILERYVGVYRMNPLARMTITREGDFLLAQLTGQPAFRIHPLSATRFFYRVVEAEISFDCDADGAATRLVLHQGGKDMPMERITE